MTTPLYNQLSIFPDMPRTTQLVDGNGTITKTWQLFFDHLVTALQTNYKPDGLVIPGQSAANIASFTSTNSQRNIIYDTTNQAYDANIINTTTGDQIWVQLATIVDYAGNPNGNVEGNLNQLCLDTAAPSLWICTTPGNAAGAVWTAV